MISLRHFAGFGESEDSFFCIPLRLDPALILEKVTSVTEN